jgi:hypothetical protein
MASRFHRNGGDWLLLSGEARRLEEARRELLSELELTFLELCSCFSERSLTLFLFFLFQLRVRSLLSSRLSKKLPKCFFVISFFARFVVISESWWAGPPIGYSGTSARRSRRCAESFARALRQGKGRFVILLSYIAYDCLSFAECRSHQATEILILALAGLGACTWRHVSFGHFLGKHQKSQLPPSPMYPRLFVRCGRVATVNTQVGEMEQDDTHEILDPDSAVCDWRRMETRHDS